MRIKVDFETKNELLHIEIRRKFVSFLKSAFEDYSKDFFDLMYGAGHQSKAFCFSIYFLPGVKITKSEITLPGKRFNVFFSTRDNLMGIHLANALLGRYNKWFPLADCDNQLKVLSVTKVKESSITTDAVAFKILSPVVVRDHNEKTGKDWYFTFEDEDFERIWKRNLKSELTKVFGGDVVGDVERLQFKPISLKKVVVLNYGIYLPCTTGAFIMEGEQYLLKYLYQGGWGSKKSLGFGLLDVL